MNPLQLSLTREQNTLSDLGVSIASTAVSHPWSVYKSLQQSEGICSKKFTLRHLCSGLPLRLLGTPIFLGLGGCNYYFKQRFSEGGARLLTPGELMLSALISGLISAPFYQVTDVAVYRQNLARVQGERSSLLFTARQIYQSGTAFKTLPITAFLCTLGGANTFALGPLIFSSFPRPELGAAALSSYTLLYALATQPLDTLRTRIQQNPQTKIATLRQEGLKALWRGSLIRSLSHTSSSLTYIFFQQTLGSS